MEMVFRFWDRLAKRWTVVTCGEPIKTTVYPFTYTTFDHNDNLLKSIVPTQAIGENDKHGKKIFVGDWIHNKHDELYLIQHDGVCIYAERFIPDYRCMGECCADGKIGCWTSESISPLYSVLADCEVVGNEFEHPELYQTFFGEQKKEGEY